MPLVQIKGVGGYLTLAQKQEMIRKVTEAVLPVEGSPVTDDDLRALAGRTVAS